MKTVITSTKKNPLIGRRELKFLIEEPSTPSRTEIRRDIAVTMQVDLDRVWVKKYETITGTNKTVGLVHIYDDAETAVKVEPEYLRKKNQKLSKAQEEASEI
jgi:ribosomal protein S24E